MADSCHRPIRRGMPEGELSAPRAQPRVQRPARFRAERDRNENGRRPLPPALLLINGAVVGREGGIGRRLRSLCAGICSSLIGGEKEKRKDGFALLPQALPAWAN